MWQRFMRRQIQDQRQQLGVKMLFPPQRCNRKADLKETTTSPCTAEGWKTHRLSLPGWLGEPWVGDVLVHGTEVGSGWSLEFPPTQTICDSMALSRSFQREANCRRCGSREKAEMYAANPHQSLEMKGQESVGAGLVLCALWLAFPILSLGLGISTSWRSGLKCDWTGTIPAEW